jgi:hypothetical protein
MSKWPETAVRPCGTEAAYRRHKRRGEIPCLDCCHAHSTARSATRRRAVERAYADPLGEVIHVLATAMGYPRRRITP